MKGRYCSITGWKEGLVQVRWAGKGKHGMEGVVWGKNREA
jgi:hypothetical protein